MGSESQHPLPYSQRSGPKAPPSSNGHRDHAHESGTDVRRGIDQAHKPVVPVVVWVGRILAMADAEILGEAEICAVGAGLRRGGRSAPPSTPRRQHHSEGCLA